MTKRAEMTALRAWGALSLVLCLVAGLPAQQWPAPTGPVNDFADVLTAAEEAALTVLAAELEQATSAELAVATVTSLQGISVEEFASRLFAAWGIGRQKLDNGVLVLVAPNEREMRIEVGYGLEGVLPDGLAGEIIRTEFLPRFREDDYAGGILAGSTRIAEIVRRNHVLSPEERAALDPSTGDELPPWALVSFLSLFVGVGFFLLGLGVGAQAMAPILFGALFGGMPFLMALVMTPLAGTMVLFGVAALALTGGRRFARRPEVRSSLRGGGKKAPGTWVWGASRASSGSGSSSSGFGGGSSGGGGASGRW